MILRNLQFAIVKTFDNFSDEETESPSADQSHESIDQSDDQETEKEEDRGAAEGGQTEGEDKTDVKENGRI